MNFSTAANELQLTPSSPLAPGHYEVVIAGDGGAGRAVVVGANSLPLGGDAGRPSGRDFISTFQVDGIDGVRGAVASADTPATSHDLGDVTTVGIVQVAGAIGVDPYRDPSNPGSPANNPANDVQMYHFHIGGPGRYSFIAEVFAGRIGSPLSPGLSLYRLDPADHSLHLVDGNIGTDNATMVDGTKPLFTDPALFEGLTEGDYVLTVADGVNTVSPADFQPSGGPGLLDPSVSHSARLGASTGPYVLNLLVQPTPTPPVVLGSNPPPPGRRSTIRRRW